MFSLSKSDKVLVVAPHPDDESLGTGGLLQRVFAQRIPVRIVFATNGENNPWAQRYWERRWRIGSEERRRWGQRRREEALNAVCTLGGKPDCAKFLNLPDLGTTPLLMQGGPELSALMSEEIQDWGPTVALIPTIFDSHPDHSALSVAFSMALSSVGNSSIRGLEYLVHQPHVPIPREPARLHLSAEEVERKRRAILCHKTQVALSRVRFTSFAKTEESYYPHKPVGVKMSSVQMAAGRIYGGVLTLQFPVSRRERLYSEILFAFKSRTGIEYRWKLPISCGSGKAQIWDTVTNRRLHDAIVRWNSVGVSVDIPVPGTSDVDSIYAKLSGWTLFFDRSGWSQFTVSAIREEAPVRRAKAPRLATIW